MTSTRVLLHIVWYLNVATNVFEMFFIGMILQSLGQCHLKVDCGIRKLTLESCHHEISGKISP